MSLTEIKTMEAPQAIGPYSQAIKLGELLYCSGQIPLDPQTQQIIPGDIAAQTTQVMENISAVLKAGNSSLGKIVKTTIFLKNFDDFQQVNQVYQEYLQPPYPARSTVEVARLPLNVGVEIEVIALAHN